jgi:mRNA turnover protein 4
LIIRFFDAYTVQEFAKAGTIANQTIILPKGPKILAGFSHSMEPYFRQLGLNTTLVNGEIILNEDFVVAEEGKPLNVEQAKILVRVSFPIVTEI